ncbi:MAG: hypothetical protein BZ151_08685 [Desulfobacca sp. 4484_104]|nr:MAG: hypothetical protein BZ151_08685 [Desulfobacca sp. 4484_104]
MAKDNKILVSTLSLSEPSLPEQATVGTRCNVPALLTLALLLIFAPLAFGGVHTWAYSLIQLVLLSFGLVVVGQQMWGLVRSPNTYRLEWPGHPLTPLIFGLIGAAVFNPVGHQKPKESDPGNFTDCGFGRF